jgi:hypothetical protein
MQRPFTQSRHLPRIRNEAHELLVLEIDLTHDPVQNSLAGAVSRTWIRALLHAADAAQRTADSHKRGLGAFLEQRVNRLVEVDGPVAIDLDVLLQHGDRQPVHGREVLADAGVGDYHIQVVNAMLLLESLNGSRRVGGRLRVYLHHD